MLVLRCSLLSTVLSMAATVSAQYGYLYSSIGFGAFQSGGSEFVRFENASRNPIYQHSFRFQGFNFSDASSNNFNTNSSETWSLNLNYSALALGTNNISNTVYSLTFPEAELPITNASDWQLCAHISAADLPSNISSISATNDGNCVPYLGQECYDAYLAALRSSAAYGTTNCPSGLTFGSVPACRAHFGFVNQTVATAGILNTTDPELYYVYNNRTYINSTNGQVVTDPVFHGLRSNDPYAWTAQRLMSLDNSTVQADASMLLFSALSLTTSESYRANNSRSSNGQAGTANNVRLFCGRVLASSSGGPINGAVSVRDSPLLMVLALAIMSMLWLA